MPNWLGGLSGGLTALGNEIGGGSGGAGQAGGANGQSQPYQPLKQMSPFKAIGKGFGQYITNRQKRGALGAGSGSDMGSNDPNPGGPSDWANVDDDEMGTPGMAAGGEVGDDFQQPGNFGSFKPDLSPQQAPQTQPQQDSQIATALNPGGAYAGGPKTNPGGEYQTPSWVKPLSPQEFAASQAPPPAQGQDYTSHQQSFSPQPQAQFQQPGNFGGFRPPPQQPPAPRYQMQMQARQMQPQNSYQPQYRPQQQQGYQPHQMIQSSPLQQRSQQIQRPSMQSYGRPQQQYGGSQGYGRPQMQPQRSMQRGPTAGMAQGGEVRPQIAEALMRRYSPIGPRNPQVTLQPSPQGMAHRLPQREAITPRLNVRVPRPKIPNVKS